MCNIGMPEEVKWCFWTMPPESATYLRGKNTRKGDTECLATLGQSMHEAPLIVCVDNITLWRAPCSLLGRALAAVNAAAILSALT